VARHILGYRSPGRTINNHLSRKQIGGGEEVNLIPYFRTQPSKIILLFSTQAWYLDLLFPWQGF